MRWWAELRSHLKWLRPGMGVKRWLLLLVLGLVLLGLGVAALAQLVETTTWLGIMGRLRLHGIGLVLLTVLFLGGGAVVVGLAIYNMNRSLVSAFRGANRQDVAEVVYRHRQRQRGPRVVTIGGGHGLSTLLRGLKEYTDNITAIVTVADDGGSSGRLRRELGMLPPGDFRNCIAALSDAEGLVTQLFQYRFGQDSDLEGHSFGNLYLTAMTAITGSFEAALAESSRVLAVRGQVIPSTLAQVTLGADVLVSESVSQGAEGQGQADDEGILRRIAGESAITAAHGQIQRVYLEPENAPAYPTAIRAILEADLIVAGPGSLYTSVLPNLLVADLARAVASASAPKVYVCNVATEAGETEGYDVDDHMEALSRHIGQDLFGVVLANDCFSGEKPPGVGVDWVRLPRPGAATYHLVTRDLVDQRYPWRHDPERLAQALMEFVKA